MVRRRDSRYWIRYVIGVVLGLVLGWVAYRTIESRMVRFAVGALIIGVIASWISGEIRVTVLRERRKASESREDTRDP
jgi:F0F1-type ATP synthase assembly protein I